MTLEKHQCVTENMRTVLENMKNRYAPRDDGLDLRTADADGHGALVDAFLRQEAELAAANETIAQLRQRDTVRPEVDETFDGDRDNECDCIHCR